MKYYCYLIFITIFILILSGCKPSVEKPIKFENVPNSQISWELRRENGIENVEFIYGDLEYMIVDEDWFKSKILPGYHDFLVKNGIQHYNSLKNDCDDYARAFTFYCRITFRSLGYMKSSPAIGEFYYRWIDGSPSTQLFSGGHAICVAVFFDKNGNKVVRFIEPQPPVKIYPVDAIDPEIRKYYVKHIGM